MSLATQSGALIVRLGALAIDCLCCTLCRGETCSANSECQEGCSCVSGRCRGSCTDSVECPAGYECVNGICVPKCQGESCAATGFCDVGCACVDGQCWPESDLYYCVRAGLDQKGCQNGRPPDESDIEGGPYLTYLECCEEGCGCKYDCVPASATGSECIARPAGFYENQSACEADCGDGEDVGACCETYPVEINGQVVRYEKGPAANCPSTRAECQSEPPVYRSFRVSITDCNLCPITQFGACCTDDGCIDESQANPGSPIDPFECEQILGGVFKDAWEDCTTHRDPTITAQFACDDCNGGFDCNCGMQEHCVNRVCVQCLDQVIEVPETAAPAWHDTGIEVAAGATVTLIAKQCDDLEWGTTIRSQVGEGLLQTGSPDLEYVADLAGNLQVRLERQGAPAAGQICIAIVTPPPPPPPPPCGGAAASGGIQQTTQYWSVEPEAGSVRVHHNLGTLADRFRFFYGDAAEPFFDTGFITGTSFFDVPKEAGQTVIRVLAEGRDANTRWCYTLMCVGDETVPPPCDPFANPLP